jgi:parallel beta-helix repeat protein
MTSRMARHTRSGCVIVAAAAAALATSGPAAQADPPPTTTYVSPTGTPSALDSSCATAGFSTVQSAVDATAAGGIVIVCNGTYAESVTVTSQLTLQGQPGAIINAKGQPYAVGLAHSHDTVTGLTVENATENSAEMTPGDGIITAGFVDGTPVASNDDLIVGNIAKNNEGTGIDLNSTTGSVAADNVADGNGAGINLSNDLGSPASHNRVIGNVTSHNPGGCGIVLADHSGVGVFGNVIDGNTSNDNGLGTPSRPSASSGSGVIIAASGKTGGVYNNLIESNRMTGNGHGGVALHAHSKGPKFSGNRIIDNTIGKNNLRTDYKDLKTTGVYLGDAAKGSIIVADNLFTHNAIGVFSAGPIAIKGKHSNAFESVATHFAHIATYAG